jgi:collagenase-like PrtC family protease
MKISLGPIYYYWTKKKVLDFYDEIADTPVDIVYLGEVVCSKRNQLMLSDWLSIAKKLKDAGKEVVLSTLILIESDSELKRLTRVCKESEYLIESNDFAAINIMRKQNKSFAVGPNVNIYNAPSLNMLAKSGLKRWCFPVELSKFTLQEIINTADTNVEVEVFVFGSLPLSFSARCFTARAYNSDKDGCKHICLNHKDGLLVSTQEQKPFLIMNGIQTMSADNFNLIGQVEVMNSMGVNIIRISPQFNNTGKVIEVFKDRVENIISNYEAQESLATLSEVPQCDGYWFEKEGMCRVEPIQ